jgi:uncharacterized surface protein with fasciclin (FAS1) repeats
MRLTLCLLLIALFGLTPLAAQDDPPTIAAIVAADARLTTMNALIELSDTMRALLDDPDGAFTLFAPLNGNWTVTTYWDTTFDLAEVVSDPARAEVLLRYYILPMVIGESEFLYTQPVYLEYGTMLPGYTIYANMQDGEYIYNSLSSIIETIPASNGVVLVVNTAPPVTYFTTFGREMFNSIDALPPGIAFFDGTRPVIALLEAAGEFSTLLRLFEAEPEIAAQLANGGIYTVFAPTDAAFEMAGIDEALLAQFMGNPEFPWARLFLQGRILPGYFTPPTLRLFTVDGRLPEFATLGGDALPISMYDFATNRPDDLLRFGGLPFDPDPIIARGAVIYVQREMYPPG